MNFENLKIIKVLLTKNFDVFARVYVTLFTILILNLEAIFSSRSAFVGFQKRPNENEKSGVRSV